MGLASKIHASMLFRGERDPASDPLCKRAGSGINSLIVGPKCSGTVTVVERKPLLPFHMDPHIRTDSVGSDDL